MFWNPTLWSEVLVARYGQEVTKPPLLENLVLSRFASSWWKDISRLGFDSNLGGLVWGEVLIKVCNGESTSFLRDIWVGTQPLNRVFLRLFLISTRQNGRVADLGSWVDG